MYSNGIVETTKDPSNTLFREFLGLTPTSNRRQLPTMASRNFNTNTAQRQSMALSGGAVKARQLVCSDFPFVFFSFAAVSNL